jgi:PBP1b-binding outer membrane lipoprotein LpoB
MARQARTGKPIKLMKKLICILASVVLLGACEQKTTTVNPPAEKKTESNTTIVNPPAGKKTETNTTIVNPTDRKHTESTTTTTTSSPNP